MANEDFDIRMQRLAEKEQALAESVERLRGSIGDLKTIVQAMAQNTREQRERDREYFRMMAAMLNSLAGDGQAG